MKIKIDNVFKNYGKHEVLKGINLTVEEVECIGIIGLNGAGKTTLLKILTGILGTNKGVVTVDGNCVLKEQNNIGYLPQYPKFHDWMNAMDVLKLYARLSGIKESDINELCAKTLRVVNLEGYENRKVNSFSGGMKQRLGIAQAIIHNPKIIILDEPVSSLDPVGRREVLDLIKKIKKKTTVIFSTHILGDAEEVCDRFCLIKRGEIIDDFYISDKYSDKSANIISIELLSNASEWIEYIVTQEYVKNVTRSENSMQIEVVENNEKIKKLVTESLWEHKVLFSCIRYTKFSLEKYFIDMVGETNA